MYIRICINIYPYIHVHIINALSKNASEEMGEGMKRYLYMEICMYNPHVFICIYIYIYIYMYMYINP
jgi:hypothetical protein